MMRKDFTIKKYIELMEVLIDKGFLSHRISGLRREDSVENEKIIVFRQDVDRQPENSLVLARIQHKLGIKSTFYFRIIPKSFDPEIMEQIVNLRHDIGYHYEDLSLVNKYFEIDPEPRTQNPEPVFEEGIKLFEKHLNTLRKYVDIKTICMHGSPMSKWDSRLLWKYYDYREFGVEVDPYFDVNFEDMLYLTDTGRRWNGSSVSVRDKAGSPPSVLHSFGGQSREQGAESLDTSAGSGHRAKGTVHRHFDMINAQDTGSKWDGDKVNVRDKGLGIREQGLVNMDRYADWKVKPRPGSLMNMTEKSIEFQAKYSFKSTNDIIRADERDELPDKIMMTFHPQRWTNQLLPWFQELIWQNTKNVAKYFLIRLRD